MFFILQKEDVTLDIDLLTLKIELDKQKFQHKYIYMSLNDLKSQIDINKIKEAIPVGTIDFVQTYLDLVYNIKNMNPIEVPDEMRLDKFLNRKYSVIDKNELLSKNGYYFTKYASQLKQFTHIGLVETLMYSDNNKEPFLKEGMYIFSEVKKILAEYRVFILNDEIKGIQFYDGLPTIMPTPKEINKIKEMTLRYMLNSKRPQAYSLDIAIIDSNNTEKRDIMILECHPFCSLGLYGLVGSFLPYAYRAGLDWYIKYNTPITKFSNF